MARLKSIRFTMQQLASWESFHDSFAQALGFFDGYGRNMDAWIDCMSSLQPDDNLTEYSIADDEVLGLELEDFESFSREHPEQCAELLQCTAFLQFSQAIPITKD